MRSALIALIGSVLLSPTFAQSTVQADHVTLSSALEAPAHRGSTVWAAVRQVIAPGWHTYWRNPGDAGLPTSISWVLPKGVSAGPPLWPAPRRFADGGVVSYGYAGDATLLVPLKVAPNAVIGQATAKVFLLECEHMCIPEHVTLGLDLRRASGTPGLFASARNALPQPFRGSADVSSDAKHVTLRFISAQLASVQPDGVHFYPASAGVVDDDAVPAAHISGDTLTWTAARLAHSNPFGSFDGVLEVDGVGAFAVTAATAPAASPSEMATMTLLEAVLLAFLGGLVLNLMPCVLPILSMKAIALAQSGGDVPAARRDGIAYFAGVVAMFAGIGGVLLLLKGGGAAVGWGFQLQSPLVVFALALLMAAIGLNLLGAFEVPLDLAGIGNGLTRGSGTRGAFFTGALAVMVASPCTAPFMGAAIGFALAQPAVPALAVFLALGTGFALPFTTLAFAPMLARLVPRPGPWMIRFRQALAFPMLATAIWLVWVLDQQTGPTGLALALSVGLALAFLAWLLPVLHARWRWLVGIAGTVALIVLSLNIETASSASDAGWAPWSEHAVDGARLAGKPVLVDFSAAWCVTCLVNERVALQNPTVIARLAHDRILTLKGDWTNRNAAISRVLEVYGRSGVPLYLLYPPDGAARAVVLPQILTPETVLSALDRLEFGHAPVDMRQAVSAPHPGTWR